MPVVISLLRAVNLGGHNRVSMEQLRAMYRSLGFEDPRTYVQSGNVVFWAGERNSTALAKRLESAFEKEFGFETPIVLRTLPEWEQVVVRNPFAGRSDISPGKVLVTFLTMDASADARAKLLTVSPDGEELVALERELFIYFPNGAGRSKLNAARLEKIVGCSGTARNWNSVLNLLAMAEELESIRASPRRTARS